jgi:hypothetical protein
MPEAAERPAANRDLGTANAVRGSPGFRSGSTGIAANCEVDRLRKRGEKPPLLVLRLHEKRRGRFPAGGLVKRGVHHHGITSR